MKCPICHENAICGLEERICSECLDIIASKLAKRIIEEIYYNL